VSRILSPLKLLQPLGFLAFKPTFALTEFCLSISLSGDSPVDHSIKITVGGDFNQGPDFRVKPTKKSFLLLLVIIDIFWCITRQLCELMKILYHSQTTLTKLSELIPLELHNTAGNVMFSEDLDKVSPYHLVGVFIYFPGNSATKQGLVPLIVVLRAKPCLCHLHGPLRASFQSLAANHLPQWGYQILQT